MNVQRLAGKIALVTGGSRGAGRGIAVELGCDHTSDEETQALIERIRQEQGRLHILVNNVWGLHDLEVNLQPKPFWEYPLNMWDAMFQSGVRAQIATNHYAIPLMLEADSGLIVHTTFRDQEKYLGTFYYDLAKNTINRSVFGLAHDLKNIKITVVAVSPGWMRTELVLRNFDTDEDHWKEVEALKHTESPYYIGRAVSALAGDGEVQLKNGLVLQVGDLAQEYGFTDIDGRFIPPFLL